MLPLLLLPFLFVSCDNSENIPVEGILIMPEVHTQVGETTELVPYFTPHNATNRSLTWTAVTVPDEDADPDEEIITVVTVNSGGLVTAEAIGTAHVVAVTADGGHADTSLFRVFSAFEHGCNEISGNSVHFFGGGSAPTFTLGGDPRNPPNTIVVGDQQWSGPVQRCFPHVPGAGGRGTSTANFTGFNSTQGGSFNADCRPNFNDADGALYSWCAVIRFADQMCPPNFQGDNTGWRVPTAEDFAILDQHIRSLAGEQVSLSGREPYISLPVVEEYVRSWRANFSGIVLTGANATTAAGITGHHSNNAAVNRRFGAYWSQTEHGPTSAYFFYIGATGQISPQEAGVKSSGRTVRCVRDWPRP